MVMRRYMSNKMRARSLCSLAFLSVLISWQLIVLGFLHQESDVSHGYLRDPVSQGSTSMRRPLLPASIWATRELGTNSQVNITRMLSKNETEKAMSLCGGFLYSSLTRAIHIKSMGEDAFVATGDIDSMWTRDSVVQLTIYLKYIVSKPWLRFIVEGAIRRNAFNIIQDPYANAYEHQWKDPTTLSIKEQVIGRGGFVATRNYEVDSGAYFLNHLYDYYVTKGIYRPNVLLEEPMVFEAVMLMVNTWIVEQYHDEKSPYRYFELPKDGKGLPTAYTGMTWAGFRPSDDACKYGYLIPANIHAAAALQRIIILNERIWENEDLATKASKLLKDIEQGINTHGIVRNKNGESIYAYEVDGLGGVLSEFDDANIPSLLSIPLLGWDGYDKEAYRNTRKYLLSKSNKSYFEGTKFRGVGSPHTPHGYVWPMALVVEGLTETGLDREDKMAFQMRQLLLSATGDAMHESVQRDNEKIFTRAWFEWTNALFAVYVETVMSTSCAGVGNDLHRANSASKAVQAEGRTPIRFYSNPYHNKPTNPLNYQDVTASVHFE